LTNEQLNAHNCTEQGMHTTPEVRVNKTVAYFYLKINLWEVICLSKLWYMEAYE